MSPLIFNLALEPLAIAKRSGPDIERIKIKDKTIKMGIYTDDVVCYLSSLESLFKKLTQWLEVFSLITEYKVNQRKTVDGI